jgi:hypothetical protein
LPWISYHPIDRNSIRLSGCGSGPGGLTAQRLFSQAGDSGGDR